MRNSTATMTAYNKKKEINSIFIQFLLSIKNTSKEV